MSRNLCIEHCHQCLGDDVVHEEPPRPLTREDAGVYFDEPHRVGMLVANAVCQDCGAKYLAWVAVPAWNRDAREDSWYKHGHFDLSYRSTFNDEPGPDDLPPRSISVALAKQALRHGDKPSHWGVPALTAEDCIEVAEAWMNRADELRKAAT